MFRFFTLYSVFNEHLHSTLDVLISTHLIPLRHKLVGSSGLEPPTSRLSGARSNQLSYEPILVSCVLSTFGGDDGVRTHDPLLAGQVLSQLSYTPIGLGFHSLTGCFQPVMNGVGLDLSSRTVAGEVLSALHSLTSVFGLGTGGPCA